jgi:hypothetical protein
MLIRFLNSGILRSVAFALRPLWPLAHTLDDLPPARPFIHPLFSSQPNNEPTNPFVVPPPAPEIMNNIVMHINLCNDNINNPSPPRAAVRLQDMYDLRGRKGGRNDDKVG